MGGCPKSFRVTKLTSTRKERVTEEIKGRYIKRRSLMKRSLCCRRRRRASCGLEIARPRNDEDDDEVVRKVKTLKKLVPNSSGSKGLVGLFTETADYILALQMRIQLMQVMVNGLSSSNCTITDNFNLE